MNCVFCHRPCRSAFTEAVQLIGVLKAPGRTEMRIEECRNHPWVVEYTIYNDGLLKYTFFVPFKGKNWLFAYLITQVYSLKTFVIICGDETLLDLDYFPNITPDNAFDKLPTILTFL